jgi:hypothetical protein
LNPTFRIQPIGKGENPPHHKKEKHLESGWWTDPDTGGQFAVGLERDAVREIPSIQP